MAEVFWWHKRVIRTPDSRTNNAVPWCPGTCVFQHITHIRNTPFCANVCQNEDKTSSRINILECLLKVNILQCTMLRGWMRGPHLRDKTSVWRSQKAKKLHFKGPFSINAWAEQAFKLHYSTPRNRNRRQKNLSWLICSAVTSVFQQLDYTAQLCIPDIKRSLLNPFYMNTAQDLSIPTSLHSYNHRAAKLSRCLLNHSDCSSKSASALCRGCTHRLCRHIHGGQLSFLVSCMHLHILSVARQELNTYRQAFLNSTHCTSTFLQRLDVCSWEMTGND